MAEKKRKPMGYSLYQELHKFKTGQAKGGLSPEVYSRDPLKAFETLGLKPGPLTKRLRGGK